MIKDNTYGFSEFFTFKNMTKSNRYKQAVEANRQEALEYLDNGRALSFLMEGIRLFLGVRIIESSGFRGKTLSLLGKFSLTSTHCKFEALDGIPVGMSVTEAFNKIKDKAHLFPNLRKVILEKIDGKEWLHIEVKTSEKDTLAFYTTIDGKNYIKA